MDWTRPGCVPSLCFPNSMFSFVLVVVLFVYPPVQRRRSHPGICIPSPVSTPAFDYIRTMQTSSAGWIAAPSSFSKLTKSTTRSDSTLPYPTPTLLFTLYRSDLPSNLLPDHSRSPSSASTSHPCIKPLTPTLPYPYLTLPYSYPYPYPYPHPLPPVFSNIGLVHLLRYPHSPYLFCCGQTTILLNPFAGFRSRLLLLFWPFRSRLLLLLFWPLDRRTVSRTYTHTHTHHTLIIYLPFYFLCVLQFFSRYL
jgi:hypothetical protein